MSSNSYGDTCPNCQKEMDICQESRPIDYTTGQCPHCGFYYFTKTGQMDLVELNVLRDDLELKPLKKLPAIDEELLW